MQISEFCEGCLVKAKNGVEPGFRASHLSKPGYPVTFSAQQLIAEAQSGTIGALEIHFSVRRGDRHQIEARLLDRDAVALMTVDDLEWLACEFVVEKAGDLLHGDSCEGIKY